MPTLVVPEQTSGSVKSRVIVGFGLTVTCTGMVVVQPVAVIRMVKLALYVAGSAPAGTIMAICDGAPARAANGVTSTKFCPSAIASKSRVYSLAVVAL